MPSGKPCAGGGYRCPPRVQALPLSDLHAPRGRDAVLGDPTHMKASGGGGGAKLTAPRPLSPTYPRLRPIMDRWDTAAGYPIHSIASRCVCVCTARLSSQCQLQKAHRE